MTSKTIFFLTILVIGGAFIFLSFQSGQPNTEGNLGNGPTVSVSPVSGSPTLTPKSNSSDDGEVFDKIPDQSLVQSPVPRSLITGPATCQLEGSIVFIDDNIYETKGAKLKYQNIDDSSRLIFWKISPNDGVMTAGPNIFANVKPLPNGEVGVGVTPNKNTSVDKYNLTASVTYGVILPNGSEEVRTANCSGSISVIMP